jgi:hypothetical protein
MLKNLEANYNLAKQRGAIDIHGLYELYESIGDIADKKEAEVISAFRSDVANGRITVKDPDSIAVQAYMASIESSPSRAKAFIERTREAGAPIGVAQMLTQNRPVLGALALLLAVPASAVLLPFTAAYSAATLFRD